LRADRDKLKHVLQNLINNALKFTDEGKVSVTARQIPGSVHVELTVGDAGFGIPDDELPNLRSLSTTRQLKNPAYGGSWACACTL